MNKSKILVISVVFLVMISFVVFSQDEQKPYNDMSRGEQEEFLMELFGERTTITPDDVSIDPYTGTISIKNGYAVLTDIGLPVVVDGVEVLVDVQQYSGTIEIGANGGVIQGKHSLLTFKSGETVTVVNGVIVQIKNANLDEGSRIGNTFVHGKDISYDIENRRIISGNKIVIDGIIYKPESGNVFHYDLSSGIVDTQGEWIIVETPKIAFVYEGEYIGKIKGLAQLSKHEFRRTSVLLIASEETLSEFENDKETKIKVSSDTWIGLNYYGDEDIPTDISTIRWNNEQERMLIFSNFYVNSKGGNKIEIEAKDGDYTNFIVRHDEDSEVNLVLEKNIFNKAVFYFKEDKQLEQGNIKGFETNIEYIFDGSSLIIDDRRGIPSYLHYIVTLAPTSLLNKLTKDYGRGIKALSHYLYASGEPMDIDMSDGEWESLIRQTEGGEWVPNTNPEYHADDGWEHMSIGKDSSFRLKSDNAVTRKGWGEDPRLNDVWNLLGKTTLRRRATDEGYHYMIAGETFDFVGGDAEDFERYSRYVTKFTADAAEYFFPDIFIPIEEMGEFSDTSEAVLLYVNNKWIQDHGEPFPIVGDYIKKD